MYEDVKLIMVTTNNNNKFYNMHNNNDNTFNVTYGRVGSNGTTKTYSIYDWNKLYNAKIKKGYIDVSDTTTQVIGYAPEPDSELEDLLQHLLNISRQYVNKQTDIGTLNQKTIVKVQDKINELTRIKSDYCGKANYNEYLKNNAKIDTVEEQKKYISLVSNKFNKILVTIFEIIPRKMKDVRQALYNENCILYADSMDSYISNEQSLLDNISIQSKSNQNANGINTISQAFGFNFTKASNEETDFVKDKINKESDSGSFTVKNVYKVSNPKRDDMFEEFLQNNNLKNDDKNIKLYWHGTGPENILSIMANGLVIRPANASYCGSAFGDGIYSAPSPNKSYNYTSRDTDRHSRWMFINAVIEGNAFDCEDNYDKIGNIKICDLDGNSFSQLNLGYHSVHAHATKSSYIRRDEVIVYNNSQVACRYLVEVE